MQRTSWETLGWRKHRLEGRLPAEIPTTSDMQMTPPYGRKWRGTKEPLDEGERGEWKSWLKTQIMASSPITSRQIDGETMETVTDFIFLGSKSTADGDCSHEIKRHLLFGRKAMTKPDSILKSRNITLPTKIHLVKARDLDYKESWVPKNWCFWTVVLEKTLESPLDCKEIQSVHPKGNQS